MKSVPAILLAAYMKTLREAAVPVTTLGPYQKWLRFYLDFCMKYRHPPRDPDSLAPFAVSGGP